MIKEKLKERKEQVKNWWNIHKDKIVKLSLAGGVLYMAGYIHATNKTLNHDRVIMEKCQDDDIEVINF